MELDSWQKSRPIRHEKASFLGRMSPEMTDFKFIFVVRVFWIIPRQAIR